MMFKENVWLVKIVLTPLAKIPVLNYGGCLKSHSVYIIIYIKIIIVQECLKPCFRCQDLIRLNCRKPS